MIRTIRTDRLLSKAETLIKEDALDKAIEVYEQAIAESPRYSHIYLHKALVLSDKDESDKAIAGMTKAIELNPTSPVYHMFLGRILYDAQRFDDALQEFEKSLSIDPKNTLSVSFRDLTNLTIGRPSGVYDRLRRNVNFTNADFQSRLLVLCESFLYEKKKGGEPTSFGQSIQKRDTVTDKVGQGILKLFTRVEYQIFKLFYNIRYVVDRKRKSAELHILKGDKASLLEAFEIALNEYNEALRILPEFDKPKEHLAIVYYEKKEYEHALQYLTQTERYESRVGSSAKKEESKDYSTDGELSMMLGVMYYELGQYERAVEELTSAAKLSFRDYEPLYYLGLCCVAKRDHNRARTWFKKAMEKNNPRIAQTRLNEFTRASISGNA
jgi:tetratricopeptide (TPR) repeat protein